MTAVAVGTLVLIINLSIFLVVHWAVRRTNGGLKGTAYVVAEFLRLAVFFLGAHILWGTLRHPWGVVAFIFVVAIVQMTIQIIFVSYKKV